MKAFDHKIVVKDFVNSHPANNVLKKSVLSSKQKKFVHPPALMPLAEAYLRKKPLYLSSTFLLILAVL
jgi:hypothetical protein